MGYVCRGVDELAKGQTPLAGTGECVDLIKEYVPGLQGKSTSTWRPGAWVMETPNIEKGTAIATFDPDGTFPKKNTGQHAALVLRVVGSGIWVVDQWARDPVLRPTIGPRLIRIPPLGMQRNKDGSFINRSNNALAFRVIEL